MTWFTLIFIIGVIIFFFSRDRNKMLETQIDLQGGILNKYSVLINFLTQDHNARITLSKRDFIQISYILKSTSTTFNITEVFGGVEVEWIGRFGILGNHSLKWFFKHPINQEQIIEKIMLDLKKYEEEKI